MGERARNDEEADPEQFRDGEPAACTTLLPRALHLTVVSMWRNIPGGDKDRVAFSSESRQEGAEIEVRDRFWAIESAV